MPFALRTIFMMVSVLTLAHALTRAAAAQTMPATPAPTAAPSAAPSASPRPRAGLSATTEANLTFIDQATRGGGQIGPEAIGFEYGSALAPNTPYDLFSSAPETPGVAGIGGVTSHLTYGLRRFDLDLTAQLADVTGSVTNASYWGENLSPFFNPHLGSTALGYKVDFPTHAGQDDSWVLALGISEAGVATADGNLRLRAGWFDLEQSDRFVFVQPALTSVNPAIAYAPAESLSSGLAGTDIWQPYASALPLDGVDVVGKRGDATLELTNAALPALPGDGARLTMGSFVIDHGEGTRYSAQLLHVVTSGTPFVTTVPFGIDPGFELSPQGILPTSTLSGQEETIAGARAAFHLMPAIGLDGLVEIGRSWYNAAPVARPGTEAPGGFYHLGFTKTHHRATALFDLYRMEPRYATIILPYGAAENQWSAAFAWPGQWLKSNYQLIDNSVLGVNRQGYRARYLLDGGPFELHLEYTDLRQIDPETTLTATQAGYVDGYYLPQLPDAATFGRQKRYGFWAAYHATLGDLTLDIVDDTLYRPFVDGHVEDRVSYEVPQAVATYSRHLTPNVVFATGLGRYAMKGSFSEPLDFSERLFFAGLELRAGKSSTLISFRRTAYGGITTYPGYSVSPDFTGSALIVEQRYRF
jgi:hypothetical protein